MGEMSPTTPHPSPLHCPGGTEMTFVSSLSVSKYSRFSSRSCLRGTKIKIVHPGSETSACPPSQSQTDPAVSQQRC